MSELTDEYYAALGRGELVIQRCRDCSTNIMYPKYACPSCSGSELDWVLSGGTGTLHSYTVQRVGAPSGFEAELPYAVGVVKLDDGVQLLGRLHPDPDGGWDAYRCDDRVEFHAAPDRDRPIAWFRRA
jgi:uncharacterized OB-fold protein